MNQHEARYEQPDSRVLRRMLSVDEFPTDDRLTFRAGVDRWTLTHRTVADTRGLSSKAYHAETGEPGHILLLDLDGCESEIAAVNAVRNVAWNCLDASADAWETSPGRYVAAVWRFFPTLASVVRVALEVPGVDLKWLGVGMLRGELVIRLAARGDTPEPRPVWRTPMEGGRGSGSGSGIDWTRLSIIDYEAAVGAPEATD